MLIGVLAGRLQQEIEPIPAHELAILQDRYARVQADPSLTRPWSEVREKLDPA